MKFSKARLPLVLFSPFLLIKNRWLRSCTRTVALLVIFLLAITSSALSGRAWAESAVGPHNQTTSYYNLLATNSLSTGHTEPVNAALFSPDGKRLATASVDTLLRLWQLDSQTAQPRLDCTLYNFPHPLVSLAWSPDGSRLATGDSDGGLKLWTSDCKAAVKQLPQTLGTLQGSLRTVAFSPDGKWLASGGADNQVRIWSLDSASVVYSFDNGRAGINALRWSPDGQRLAFGATNDRLGVINFDPQSPASSALKLYTVSGNNLSVRSLVWSPDNHWLATGNDDGHLFLYDATIPSFEQKLVIAAATSDQALLNLAFSTDGQQLAIATSANAVTTWAKGGDNTNPTFTQQKTLSGHQGSVRSVAYSPDGRWLVSSADDHSVRLWDRVTGQLLQSLGTNLNYQTSVHWSADGQNLITTGDDGLTRLWRPADAQLNLNLPTTADPAAPPAVSRVALNSPDGKWLANAGDDGLVRVWSTDQLNGPARWVLRPTHKGALYALAFSPDSQRLFSGGQAGYIEEWKLDNGYNWLSAGTAAVGRGLHSLAVSPKGERLASGSDDGQIRLWQPTTLSPLPGNQWPTQAHQGYIKEIVFNSQGNRLFSAGGDGRVLVWDSERGVIVSGAQLGGPIKAMALAGDGQTVAVALSGGPIRVYNSATNQVYLIIQGQGLTALGLAFAPDLTPSNGATTYRLAAVTLDGALQIWQVSLGEAGTAASPLPNAGAAGVLDVTTPFVQARAANDHLSLNGQPVVLKGVNFYPRLALWAAMWQHWDGPKVAADLDQAAGLGVNCLRVLVPYGAAYEWTTPDGTLNPVMLDELDQLMGMAAQRHIRLLLTLFDFYGDFPNAGTNAEAANYRYLDSLVSHYRDNPNVLGWDIHNEPDNYPLWQLGENFQVLDWLERMSQRVRQDDPNHWLTIGFGVTTNVTKAGPDGVSPVALEDTVALHTYDPPAIVPQTAAVRSDGANHLPVFLEEYGWPSGPTELTDQYTEPVQTAHYADSFAAMSKAGLDGGIAWILWDTNYESVLRLRPLSLQSFGLLRLDGSLKPAAQVFQAAPATSLALSNSLAPALPLTIRPVDLNAYAQYFEETGFAVPTPFKEYWRRMGGLSSFGYPLSPILVERGYLVQYFERARFEYHPEATNAPDYASLDRNAQLGRIVQLGLLVDEKLTREGRQFERLAPLAGPNRTYYSLTGHNLGGRFSAFWQSQGGLTRFGYPLSEEFEEVSPTDGHTYLVQYFERARFEYHPTYAGTTYEVELGQLGREGLPPPGSR